MFRVGIMQLMGLAWLFAPFLGLAALTYGLCSPGTTSITTLRRSPSFPHRRGDRRGAGRGAFLVGCGCIYPRSVRGADPVVRGWANSRCISVEPGTDERVFVDLRGAVLCWHALVALSAPLVGLLFTWIAVRVVATAGVRVPLLVALGVGLLLAAGLAAGRDRVYPGRGGEHSDGAVLQ